MLTKTAYLAFTHCAKRFWLEGHEPNLAAPLAVSTQRRLRMGQEVDVLARKQFANGRHIPYRPQPQEMAVLTTQAIAEGAEVLFQATFAVDDLLVKVDVLQRTVVGWHLIEVKSSTRYKADEHLPDVAFQVYVLQQVGINVTQASLMHLNKECHYPDLSNLFTLTEITDEVMTVLPDLAEDVVGMRGVAEGGAPGVGIGRYCLQPDICSFHNHCWQGVESTTIYEVPYLKQSKIEQLEEVGVRYMHDIPTSFVLGHKSAVAFVQRTMQPQITIHHDRIQAELDSLVYPLYFFDFETIDYAVPAFVGCKPYQQVPFQYSCHILEADGSLTHREFLHMTRDDPREALVAALLDDIGETGHLVAYNISFERGVLHHLAAQFPVHTAALQQMADRLWDQLAIFRNYYAHPGFGGSNSLKSVLPVVVPDLSYKGLDVQNGTQAQMVWEEMIGMGDTAVTDTAVTDTAVKTQLADQLRAYCHLDTLAMVEIHRVLSNL